MSKTSQLTKSPALQASPTGDEPIKISWAMFELVDYLGQGSFGDVLKVKCLESTCLDTAQNSLRQRMTKQ